MLNALVQHARRIAAYKDAAREREERAEGGGAATVVF